MLCSSRALFSKNSLVEQMRRSLSARLKLHWLKLQNENTREFLTSRKQQKLDQHIALLKSNAIEKEAPLSPSTIWNDYQPESALLFSSPSPRPDVPRDSPTRNTSSNLDCRLNNDSMTSTTSHDNTNNSSVTTSTHVRTVVHSPRRKHRRRKHRGRRNTKPRVKDNNFNTVINLSDRVLSEHEISILSKGLKFVPTPTSVNRTELITDIKQWGRRMRLKEYFANDDNTNTEPSDDRTYKKPSKWTPSPGRDQALDCYINGVERAVLQHASNNKLRSNITRQEREAIKSLKRDKNIVIFQADKGAAVVVQNRKDYLAEAYKQLNGTDENGSKVYQPVSTDPTSDFVIRVKEAVQEAHSKEVINTDTANYLKMENAQPGNIYFLPKIHKPQRPPPARPICNTIKSATTNISKWIDDQLQPLVENLPSHLKDDNDFLCKLIELNNNHTLPPDTLLVTWDVKSLYTNIPHDGGIEACDYFMRLHNFASSIEDGGFNTK